jgi:Tripartite tricarboxylate transporter TctB family
VWNEHGCDAGAAQSFSNQRLHIQEESTVASLIRNPKDFWSGVIFIVFGVAAVFIGRDYSMGSAGRMGPAYFPTILGSILAVLGAIAVLRSLIKGGEGTGPFAVKAGLLVLFGTVLFGFLVRQAGVVVAVIVLIMLGGMANPKFRTVPYLILAIGVAIFCVLLFVKGLGLPMPIVGPLLGF